MPFLPGFLFILFVRFVCRSLISKNEFCIDLRDCVVLNAIVPEFIASLPGIQSISVRAIIMRPVVACVFLALVAPCYVVVHWHFCLTVFRIYYVRTFGSSFFFCWKSKLV